MGKFRDSAILPWLVSIATLVGAYCAFEMFSVRGPRLILLTIASGVLFIWIGLRLRHRFGVWALAAWTAAVMVLGPFALGPVAVAAFYVPSEWGVWAVAIILTPALLAATLSLHRLASRSPRPLLERDFPWALAAFGIGLLVGWTAFLTVAILPRMG
jgi:hypothetical protein